MSTQDKALAKFATSDPSKSNITNDFKSLIFTPLTKTGDLSTIIINAGVTEQVDRDKLVADMGAQGYRPLTVSELALTVIKNPQLFKGNNQEYWFNSYTTQKVGSGLLSPCFGWFGDSRLTAFDALVEWGGRARFRFLFVRK